MAKRKNKNLKNCFFKPENRLRKAQKLKARKHCSIRKPKTIGSTTKMGGIIINSRIIISAVALLLLFGSAFAFSIKLQENATAPETTTVATNTSDTPTVAINTEEAKETVKCVFKNSNIEQKCYSNQWSCGGIGSCTVDVSGQKGETTTWKSTCGGYANTTIDAQDEYAEFTCAACLTEDELNRQISECKAKGLNYQYYYDSQQCKQVSCIGPSCPSEDNLERIISECKAKGLDYTFYFDDQKCKQVSCTGTTCPSEDNLYEQIKKCKEEYRDYSYYFDEKQCKQVKCGENLCPQGWELEQKIQKCKEANGQYQIVTRAFGNTECKDVECKQNPLDGCQTQEELDKQISECKAKGMTYGYTRDDKMCLVVKCSGIQPKPCNEAFELQIKKCKEQNLGYTTGLGADGCKYAKCVYPEPTTVECKKTIQLTQPNCAPNAMCIQSMKQCIVINCTDGYEYNSCTAEQLCPRVQCSSMTDEKGCITTKCSDGTGTTGCPAKPSVECKVVKLENGCEEKRCTDGYVAQSCPTTPVATTTASSSGGGGVGCKKYTDEKGCAVNVCGNGTETRDCPKTNDNIECKTYTDDKNCAVKECSNGYTANSCTQIDCKTTVDTATNCTIKNCSDGTISKDCPQAPSVECKKYADEKGCTIKTCTDGYTDKVCPANADPTAGLEARIKSLEEVQKKQQGIIEMILSFFGIK